MVFPRLCRWQTAFSANCSSAALFCYAVAAAAAGAAGAGGRCETGIGQGLEHTATDVEQVEDREGAALHCTHQLARPLVQFQVLEERLDLLRQVPSAAVRNSMVNCWSVISCIAWSIAYSCLKSLPPHEVRRSSTP